MKLRCPRVSKEIIFIGLEAEDLYEKHPELRHCQECYFYPKFDIIKKVGIRGIYYQITCLGTR